MNVINEKKNGNVLWHKKLPKNTQKHRPSRPPNEHGGGSLLLMMMIECSKSAFHLKTGLQAKFWPSAPQKKWRHVQNCCWPVRSQWRLTGLVVMDCDGWWLNVQNLYSAERKQAYRPSFWPSALRRGWRHVQNYYWPVRPQWRLTSLVVMDCDEWWLNVWMFEICIPPSGNGSRGQSFGLQSFEGGENLPQTLRPHKVQTPA